ncbi:hypothetical protein [Cardinium endosymbiont of Dermatophagoides farinae]|uniref:hypothetical protein n=1 Tax=Cardinium endosymbiont of Dermatophagoides farinae TaxID=2597823 RepID=UPI0011823CA7|nr:hypothetical protein [Cardinium endosymbiont of Dermatophagoides farinae]TSJ81462.1 hypothetical protein FPG78_05830 [Cardinium endosymbiont of Dermatophagoides farinae]
MSVWASPIQAAAPLGSYDTPLTVAAIALNLPYPVHLLCSKNESLYDRLSYRGKYQEALLNHSLNVVSFTALSSELPAKHLFLTGAILFGIQTSTHFFCKSYGVSLIWSGLTGMLFHRLCIQKQFKWHLLLALLLNSATLVYYGYNSSAQTTIAHLSGVVAGFGLSFLLPYKKSSPSVK